jgi:translation initiation factor IF-2
LVSASIGQVGEADISLAEHNNAYIFCMDVTVHPDAFKLLKNSKVILRSHKYKYYLLELYMDLWKMLKTC